MLRTRLPLPVARAFDLHVLGLPPAFVLSQDQTLKLYEIRCLTSHISIDESQAHSQQPHGAAMVYLENV